MPNITTINAITYTNTATSIFQFSKKKNIIVVNFSWGVLAPGNSS